MQHNAQFSGYPPPTSSTTYTPNQFFDVVLPNSSRGVVRIVGYMLRRILGWSDANGNPKEPQVSFSYSELIRNANVSRTMIREALAEAISRNFIRCIREPRPNLPGQTAVSGLYELCWDDRDEYVREIENFRGFYSKNGNLTNIPNKFFDYTICEESLSVVKVVGAIIRHTIGFQTRFGMRRQQVEVSLTGLQRITGITSREVLSAAVSEAIAKNHIVRVSEGEFRPGGSEGSVYTVRWEDRTAQDEPGGPKKERTESSSNFFAQSRTGRKSPTVGRPPQDVGGPPPTGRKADSGLLQKKSFVNLSANAGGYPETVINPDRGEARERLENWTENGQRTGPRTVRKADRERFENRSDIEMTDQITINDSSKYAAAPLGEELSKKSGFELLVKAGFDQTAAASLCSTFSEERIKKQLSLLSQRAPARNPLGLLRRAIEEDWPPAGEQAAVSGRVPTDSGKRPEYLVRTLSGEKSPAARTVDWESIPAEELEAFTAHEESQREKLRAAAKLTGVSLERLFSSFESDPARAHRFEEWRRDRAAGRKKAQGNG